MDPSLRWDDIVNWKTSEESDHYRKIRSLQKKQ